MSYFITSCIIFCWMLVHDWDGILANDESGWLFCLMLSSVSFGALVNFRTFLDRVGIYKSKRYLVDLAYKDSLTKINNRRALLLQMQNIFDGNTNDEKYVLLIDVDKFKNINDAFGHDVGDEVLVKIAEILQKTEGVDLCGRLGGDEFAILKKGNLIEACSLANAINAQIEGSVVCGVEVTVSIGIALWDSRVTLGQVMRFADDALYKAKKIGSNRYSVFDSWSKYLDIAVERV
ncbi:hypothetical protein ACDW_19710 [Acidovorax sp. DW039]|uniref:GGDEF domain-containing protein n=1 Tax=Acidovorax sp. DW039 TaxID=3095606 RepID=UPI00308D0A75|nr:hypothetical protein ACDW_19710 [Acidovorax sp. DW039]